MINPRIMCLFDTICNYFGEVILKPKLIKQLLIIPSIYWVLLQLAPLWISGNCQIVIFWHPKCSVTISNCLLLKARL